MEKHVTVHWSNRTNSRLQFDSKIGSLVYKGNFTNYLPLLELGRVINMGSATTSGLGKFKFDVK